MDRIEVQFDEFDWDGNRLHASIHGVTVEEIETAVRTGLQVLGAHVRGGDWRYVAIGEALDITFTVRGERFRAISVHKLTRSKRSKR